MTDMHNAAAAWSSGYCTDLPYTMGAYKQISPVTLSGITGLKGRAAPDFSREFNYLELGCGNGVSVTANAAMYPRGTFHAVDFLPDHISFARDLSDEMGLTNLTLHEKSFADIANAPEDSFPKFDVIVFHGIISWISEENRAHLLNIVGRFLKTGGLVYSSYNCQPGWSALLPVRHVLHQHAERAASERADRQTISSMKYVRQLLEDGAFYDRMFPTAKSTIDRSLDSTQSAYMAHEWFNRDMYAPYSSQHMAELMAVKCSYIGSTDPSANVTALSVPEKIRPQLADLDDAMRETVIDFVTGRKFRQDIYGRGCGVMSGTQQVAFANQFAFIQHGELPALDNIAIGGPVGEVKGSVEAFGPIIEALREGEVTLSSLRERTDADAKYKTAWLNDILLLAWQNGMLSPASPQADLATESSAAFNRVICARHAAGDKRITTLAMPTFGTPAMVRPIEIALFDMLSENPKQGYVATVDRLIADTAAAGSAFVRAGKPVSDPTEARAVAEDMVNGFFNATAPFLVRGGALSSNVLLDAPAPKVETPVEALAKEEAVEAA